MKRAPVWTLVVLLALTFSLVEMRGDTDRVPPSVPLAEMPKTVDGLKSQDVPISQASLDVLGKGIFLNRIYQSAPGATRPVGLFIGYFPTQRSGQSIHSPQNCLPGSGWNFDHSGTTEFSAGGETYRVGEYLISNGVGRQEVLYWYRSHGRNIANDYAAKFHMLKDSILYGRTDAALVRIITPLDQDETVAVAHDRVVHFAEQLVPLLPTYIPN